MVNIQHAKINIQTIYSQHTIELHFLVSRVEPWFPCRPSKVFAIQLPFYIVIKRVKNLHITNYKLNCMWILCNSLCMWILCNSLCIVHFHYAFPLCSFQYAFALIHGVSNIKSKFCEQTSRIAHNFMGIS